MQLRSVLLSIYLVSVGQITATAQFFPQQDASWEGVTYTIAGPQPYREVLCGEAVINGQSYQQYWRVEEGADSLRYLAAVRVDEAKVFYLEPGSEGERLLYDFSLETGDSIRLQYVGLPGEASLKVASVDFVTEDTITRKVITFVPVMGIQEVWMEGVGSLFGPLNRGFVAVDAFSELFCQRIAGEVSYRSMSAGNCAFVYECTLSTSQVVAEPAAFARLYPNPTTGEVGLYCEGSQRIDLRLFNALGQCVWQEKGFSGSDSQLQFGYLPKGVYHLTLSTSDKNIYLQRFKLMITR